MERVSFLIEETNERLRCMLNPESLVFRRKTGIALPDACGGHLGGRGGAERAVFTGGGVTEVDLDLVFDVSLSTGASVVSDDVRDHTKPIWELSQNRPGRAGEVSHPPFLRFVWGKSWNLRAIVCSLSERLENFDSAGRPRRSWLRLRLLQVSEPISGPNHPAAGVKIGRAAASPAPDAKAEPKSHLTAPALPGSAASPDRLDQLAERYYGNSGLWRVIAQANAIERPDRLEPGLTLIIPALARG